jgi:Domain of unknown function (DUF4968)
VWENAADYLRFACSDQPLIPLTRQSGALTLQACSDSIIRVRYSPVAAFPSHQEFLVIKDNWPATK